MRLCRHASRDGHVSRHERARLRAARLHRADRHPKPSGANVESEMITDMGDDGDDAGRGGQYFPSGIADDSVAVNLARAIGVRPLSDPIVKQPSLEQALRSSSLRKSARVPFVLSSLPRALLPPKEGAERRMAHRDACPCKEHGTGLARPASPYGAPLRRLKSLVPHFLSSGFRRWREGVRDIDPGPRNGPGGCPPRTPGTTGAKPRAQAPLPLHISASPAQNAPLAKGDEFRLIAKDRSQSMIKIIKCHSPGTKRAGSRRSRLGRF